MANEKISLIDAARWVAKMAATDGTITPSERSVLTEFAKKYGLDVGKIIRWSYVLRSEVKVPEVELIDRNEQKGLMFESFVVSLIADKTLFRLLAWRSDKIIGDTYAIENLYPDLHISHRMDNGEVDYFIECKYRTSWGVDGIDLSGQFNRYHFHAKDHGKELFIALGVGGTPNEPEEFYLIPGRMVRHDKRIDAKRYAKCRCDQTSEALNAYINHYFNKRVIKV